MNPLSLISGALSAIGSFFNYISGRSALKNSPEMKDNQQAKQDQADSDRYTQDIAKAHKGKPENLERDES